jgi:hypothetical protein
MADPETDSSDTNRGATEISRPGKIRCPTSLTPITTATEVSQPAGDLVPRDADTNSGGHRDISTTGEVGRRDVVVEFLGLRPSFPSLGYSQ